MTLFGESLRILRRKSNDPNYPDRKLSQERLGELIGTELGLKGGYSGAAVSDWERSVSKIQADQRSLLICLLTVLHKTGGIQTPSEASELLESGNYRALNPDEVQKIFSQNLRSDQGQQVVRYRGWRRKIPFSFRENIYSVRTGRLGSVGRTRRNFKSILAIFIFHLTKQIFK